MTARTSDDPPATIDALLAHWAEATPDAPFLVGPDERLSYGEAESRVRALAAWLLGRGLRRGDRVGVLSEPDVGYALLLAAITRAGAIYVGINPRYTRAEIAHVLALADPRLNFVRTDPADADRRDRVVAAGADPAGVVDWSGVATLPGSPAAATATPPGDPQAVAVIVFTSGTTGRPKGAALHHAGLVAAARVQSERLDAGIVAPRYLNNLPVNHVGCVMNLTLAPLVAGGAVVFQRRFDAAEALALIARERVSTWVQVPAMFHLEVSHPDFAQTDFSSLRAICAGGGALSAGTLARLRAIGAPVFVEYGQTELMSTVAISDAGAPDEVLLRTIGRFEPRFALRIAGPDGVPCAPGEVGEIQARGDCVMRGYWNDTAATAAAFTADGWLMTGDLAMARTDGHVELKGRSREMIKSGGYNVYPREVEMALEAHAQIAEAIAFGVEDPLYGQSVHAAVVVRAGVPAPDAASLRAHCRQTLANYKVPKSWRMVAAMPRLPNGKVDRLALAALAGAIAPLA